MAVSNRFPYVEVQFEVRDFQEQAFAYLDTGFDGFLIIPERFMSSLGQPDLLVTVR